MAPYVAVPCGRCVACRVSRAEDWGNRMLWESDYHKACSFVTLTFSEDFLVERGLSICKDDLQRWFKRLRKALAPRVIRYYACGEYGERHGRPHYHAVLFGVGVVDREVVERTWGLGRVQVASFAPERARYTAGYLLKEVDSSIDLFGREPPFALMSKGLGKRFALSQARRIVDGVQPLTVRGKIVRAPRFFRKVTGAKPVLSFVRESYAMHLQRIGATGFDRRTRMLVHLSEEEARGASAAAVAARKHLYKGGSHGL